MKNLELNSLSVPRKVPRCSVIVSAKSDLFQSLMKTYRTHLFHHEMLITSYGIFDHVIKELGAGDIFRVRYTG